MANRHLTQRLIDALKPEMSVREVRDTELRGFAVRILPSGRRRIAPCQWGKGASAS